MTQRTIDPKVRAGEVIGGKYTVECLIGEGGMGYVVSAVHARLGERVALKFLKPKALRSRDLVARFAQEARAAARLKSEYIARVHDVGEREQDGAPYIVMEHLEGRDLGYIIEDPMRVAVADATEWIIQACAGLAEAHARGIVHRDVKPENLFLVDHGGWRSIKVVDFGISKLALTGSIADDESTVMGSPCYMSPEQVQASPGVDHRADIWSLGAVLFELLAKTTPFPSDESISTIARRVVEQEPRPLRGYRPDVPPELEAVVARCLRKSPADRFQSAAELAVALLPFAPHGARLVVERAASVTVAAGLAPHVVLPPALAPFPDDGASNSNSLLAMTAALNAPRRPGMATTQLAATRTRARPRYAWPAAALIVAIGLVGLVLVSGRRSREEGKNAIPPQAASDYALSAAPPPLVKVRVTSTPPGASVKENGVEVCVTTPCDVAYEASDATHTLVVSKHGFAPETVTMRAADVQVEAHLVPSTTTAPPKRAFPAPKPAAPKPAIPQGFKDIPY